VKLLCFLEILKLTREDLAYVTSEKNKKPSIEEFTKMEKELKTKENEYLDKTLKTADELDKNETLLTCIGKLKVRHDKSLILKITQ